jgi:hypothetical protein
MPIWQQETLAVQRLMPGWCDVGFKVVVWCWVGGSKRR